MLYRKILKCVKATPTFYKNIVVISAKRSEQKLYSRLSIICGKNIGANANTIT